MKAKTHLSQTKSRGGFTLVEMLVVIGMIATLAGISFPVYRSIQQKVEDQKMVMTFTSFDRAMENFETEYNYLPYTGAYPAADVYFNSEALFSGLLRELTGQTSNSNFKQIKFFEGPEAKASGSSYSNGLGPDGDEWYSSWGTKFFRMKIDYDGDGILSIPRAVPVDQVLGSWVIYDWSCGDGALEPVDDNFIAYKGNIIYPGWPVD